MKKSNVLLVLFFAFVFSLLFNIAFQLPMWIGFTGIVAVSCLRSPVGALMETIAPPLDLEGLKTQLKSLKIELETSVTQKAKDEVVEVQKELKALQDKYAKIDTEGVIANALTEVKDALKLLGEWKVTKDAADTKNQEFIDKIAKERKSIPLNGDTAKSFNIILAEAIEKNADVIRNYKKGSPEVKIDLLPEVKAEGNKQREVKAVGDMSISANFPAAVALYQQVGGLIQSTYNRIWIADILPNGTSNGTSIIYPKENGGEGGAALWTDRDNDKASIDYDLTTESAYFKWIAGIVVADRDMLDDIPFLLSYLQNKMLISLKTAENGFILNGSADTNPVTGLLAAATAYSGTYDKPVDRLIDAAFGQIVEDTDEFYNGTTIILRPRDAVKIGLNTADGSGEYNLPQGSASFAQGKLALAGLDTPVTTAIDANTFIALDKSATMFVRRMVPELRLYDDSALARRNKVMFRIEERATLAIFNNDAIVSGDLDTNVS